MRLPSPAARPHPYRRTSAGVKRTLLSATAGIVLALLLNGAWWAVLAHPVEAARNGDELVIPRGTADAIATGGDFVFAPERFTIPPGGHLTVVNEDEVDHTIGNTVVPPGSTAVVEATSSGELFCTIQPEGHLDIVLGKNPPLLGVVLLSVACIASAIVGARVISPG